MLAFNELTAEDEGFLTVEKLAKMTGLQQKELNMQIISVSMSEMQILKDDSSVGPLKMSEKTDDKNKTAMMKKTKSVRKEIKPTDRY